MNLVGQRIGAYQIEKLIAQGGMALVYLAHDIHTNKKVALKLLRTEHALDEKQIVRFQREAKGSTTLPHPHIIPVYAVGSANGYYYIAMRHASGGSVDDWIRQQGALPLGTIVQIISQIASALDFAHQRGIIHRDIKPSNILLSRDRETAYLADFGVAHVAGQQTVTDFGTLIGTPEFMSPEQIRGEKIDGRSDIYNLGVTLYFMLTGSLPFQGQPATVLYHQVHTDPRPPRQVVPSLPARVDRIIQKALAKRPEKRYQTAAALAHDLQMLVHPHSFSWRMATAIGLSATLVILLALYSLPNRQAFVSTPIVLTTTPGAIEAPPTTPPDSIPLAVAPTSTRSTRRVSSNGTLQPSRTPPPTEGQFTALRTPNSIGVITLNYPVPDAYISRGQAKQTFRWDWDRELADNQRFEVRFYQEGISNHQAPFGWTENEFHEIDLNNLIGRGAFEWSVAIVQGLDGHWEQDVAESERRPISWEGP